jgi:hypothetical protein
VQETITVEVEYPGPDDGGVWLAELEDLIAKAVNDFREAHPEAELTINGVG